MRISPEKLAREAQATGFRPDVLEKVARLLDLLNALQSHPFLRGKLVLKGGTALNLFVFDVPRLSVDIDLNHVGAGERDNMLAERPKIEQAVQAVFTREGFTVRRIPEEHAGGKWRLHYEDSSGGGGNLEVDINFMYRVPLWPVAVRSSHPVGPGRPWEFPCWTSTNWRPGNSRCCWRAGRRGTSSTAARFSAWTPSTCGLSVWPSSSTAR